MTDDSWLSPAQLRTLDELDLAPASARDDEWPFAAAAEAWPAAHGTVSRGLRQAARRRGGLPLRYARGLPVGVPLAARREEIDRSGDLLAEVLDDVAVIARSEAEYSYIAHDLVAAVGRLAALELRIVDELAEALTEIRGVCSRVTGSAGTASTMVAVSGSHVPGGWWSPSRLASGPMPDGAVAVEVLMHGTVEADVLPVPAMAGAVTRIVLRPHANTSPAEPLGRIARGPNQLCQMLEAMLAEAHEMLREHAPWLSLAARGDDEVRWRP